MQIRKGNISRLSKFKFLIRKWNRKGSRKEQQHNNNVDREEQHEDENEINNEARIQWDWYRASEIESKRKQ